MCIASKKKHGELNFLHTKRSKGGNYKTYRKVAPTTKRRAMQDKIRKLYFDSAHNKTVQHKL
jgi:hypothetical protein